MRVFPNLYEVKVTCKYIVNPLYYIHGKAVEGMEEVSDKELLQKNVEEFSRIQSYMSLADKTSEVYKAMKVRYIELKVILMASGVNLTELDIIKE